MTGRTQAMLASVSGGEMPDGGHQLVQIQGLDGMVENKVLFLLPPGIAARPALGGNVMLTQILGHGDLVIAIGGASGGAGPRDLAPGEVALYFGATVLRLGAGGLSIVSATPIQIDAPSLRCTGQIVGNCNGASVTLTGHQHTAPGGTSSAPISGT